MSPVDRRRNLLNILIVVVIALVIIGAVYVYINLPAGEEIFSVGEIVDNSEQYIDEVITVQGFYYHGYQERQGDIASAEKNPYSSSFPDSVQFLPVNHSKVNKTLVEGVKYRFKGTLIQDPSAPAGTAIILAADEITQV